ncbi:magnesium/cobalt transporter CorA [Anaerotalea alkaliphila]|uniref:Magnesium transport protein CorA n=1 Tax=Anaerotalea alkaliphila TaxID=2662126 RepID=A0A7X5KMY8_9FIRM|nr:magnesium/cobalt transporter CorA [Anaerotalea alkaliphila]NDL67469.1 magnesium/cobalt transporter CorA [Anaerotalea alkaliphila]
MRLLDPFNINHLKKSGVGELPGSLNYTGTHKKVEVTLEVLAYGKDGCQRYLLRDIDELQIEDKKYWINVTGLHDIELIRKIGEKFQVHLLDLEDVVHVSQRSKIEIREGYLFSIFKMVYLKEELVQHEHVSMVLADKVLISFQEIAGNVFDGVKEHLVQGNGRIRAMPIDYLFYSLLDALTDQYFLIINSFASAFNELEVKVLEENLSNTDEVYRLRKELLYLMSVIGPIREAIQNFTMGESDYFSHGIIPYYADLMDHLKQISDSVKSYREMTDSLYAMQMAKVSTDMNKTIMTLTVFSTIFIPLSFLAGVFGMNFKYFPGMDYRNAIHIFTAVCVAIAAGMLSYFKLRKW